MVACKHSSLFLRSLGLSLKKSQNTRFIHLNHASVTKHITGNHKIKEYSWFLYPKPKDHYLELWNCKPLQKINRFSLDEIWKSYLKPGHALIPLNKKILNSLPETNVPRFSVEKIEVDKVYSPKTKKSKGRGSKEFHFKTDVDSEHFAHSIYKSYHFLSRKASPSPIEVHVHPIKQIRKILQETSDPTRKEEKRQTYLEKVDHELFEALHLWPETIRRAMPEGTNITINPVSNKFREHVCWLMDLGGKNKNSQFEKNKKTHEELFNKGEGIPERETRKEIKLLIREIRKNVVEERIKKKLKQNNEIKKIKKEREKLTDKTTKKDSISESCEATIAESSTAFKLGVNTPSNTESSSAFQPDVDALSKDGNSTAHKLSEIIDPFILNQLKSTFAGQSLSEYRIYRPGAPENFHTLVNKIDFSNLTRPQDVEILIKLKALVCKNLQIAANKGLLFQLYKQDVRYHDRFKIIAIAIGEIRKLLVALDDKKTHTAVDVKLDNIEIMNRIKELYKNREGSLQLINEANRRIEEDYAKLKRDTEEKTMKELGKLSRLRRRLLDDLRPSERSVLTGNDWQKFVPPMKKVQKPEWTWKSRGSSSMFR